MQIARWRVARPLVTFFFKHMDSFLTVDRLYENEYWLAFEHPQPDYPVHFLILPKQSIRSLAEAPLLPAEMYTELIAAVQALVERFGLEEHGYRLITNGGPNQTIPQWHWHLISDGPGDSHD